MKLCIPVTEDRGLESPVSAHFGSAPLFVVADTDSGACRSIPNKDLHHSHGMCRPLSSLTGEEIDGVAVGGIGAGALGKLAAAGMRVFMTRERSVRDTVSAFRSGTLPEAAPASACGHHGHDHGQGHGCGCH
jgi:predicted Fe-Mo cluster-binding NifX family protein